MRQKLLIVSLAAALVLGLSACGTAGDDKKPDKSAEKTGKEEKDYITTGMYVQLDEKTYMFFDQKNDSPFYADIPEGELYDSEGNKPDRAELGTGDIVKLYGSQIMQESYPGRYPQVTKMILEKKGTEGDADKYKEQISTFYQKPDPSEPPYLNLEYTIEGENGAIVTAAASRYGFRWYYEDAEGNKQGVVTDSAFLLSDKNLIDLTMAVPTEVRLQFSQTPDTVRVVRWTSDQRRENETGEAYPDGESVDIVGSGDNISLEAVPAGYVYQIKAEFGESYVEYGFMTK